MYWIVAGVVLACVSVFVAQSCRRGKPPTPINSICMVAVVYRDETTQKLEVNDVTDEWKTQAGDDDTTIPPELVLRLTQGTGKSVVVAEDYDLDVRVYMGSTGDMVSSTYVDFEDMLLHVDSLLK